MAKHLLWSAFQFLHFPCTFHTSFVVFPLSDQCDHMSLVGKANGNPKQTPYVYVCKHFSCSIYRTLDLAFASHTLPAFPAATPIYFFSVCFLPTWQIRTFSGFKCICICFWVCVFICLHFHSFSFFFLLLPLKNWHISVLATGVETTCVLSRVFFWGFRLDFRHFCRGHKTLAKH